MPPRGPVCRGGRRAIWEGSARASYRETVGHAAPGAAARCVLRTFVRSRGRSSAYYEPTSALISFDEQDRLAARRAGGAAIPYLTTDSALAAGRDDAERRRHDQAGADEDQEPAEGIAMARGELHPRQRIGLKPADERAGAANGP